MSSATLVSRIKNQLEVGDAVATLDTTEAGYLNGAVAGTIAASKTVVLDSAKKFGSGQLSRMVSSNIAASTENAATTLTAFSNGTVTLPALLAGDVVRVRGAVNVSTLGSATSTNDSLNIALYIGGVAIFNTGVVADAILDDDLYFDIEIVMRTIHASTGSGYYTGIVSGGIGATSYSGNIVHGALASLSNVAAMDVVLKACFVNAANKTTLQSFIVSVN